MLIKILKTRYTQLGGLRLVRQYAKMGLLLPAAKTVLRHPFSKQTYKQAYLDTVRKVEPMLIKEYRPVMKEIAERVLTGSPIPHVHPKKIWFCWLQGLENPPEVVKACYNSLTRRTAYSLIVIDEKNWHDYITCRTISSAGGRRNRSHWLISRTC